MTGKGGTVELSEQDLALFQGRWSGEGRGSFPTVESFRFREELEFEQRGDEPLIHYVQRTWLKGERSTPSHWESGFLRFNEARSLEMSNCQNGGRVEVLTGELIELDREHRTLAIRFHGRWMGNDQRIQQSLRTFSIHDDVLEYSIEMATDKVPGITRHIEAVLTKTGKDRT
ncbi:MAG: FABP family protein [Acidobacteria bacterium]|nr:FABP family protein [Acidobacteriota bacterium]